MEWFVRAFLKASLAWLALGVAAGVAMAIHPVWTVYKAAHMHMVMLGFVTMMIYGVAYHVIPRFTGFPLPSKRWAGAHWWMSNAGLLLMVCGFIDRSWNATRGTVILSLGGTLSAAGAYVFVTLIWRTIDGPADMRLAAKRAKEVAQGAVQRARLPLA
jgi:cbb3-type cytochrome oxidase subunit 1